MMWLIVNPGFTDRTWGIEPHGPLQTIETLAKAH